MTLQRYQTFKKKINNIVEVIILNKKCKEDVLLLRLSIIPTVMPFEFKRSKFSEQFAFTTIDQAQGQSIHVCGLNFENSCFSPR